MTGPRASFPGIGDRDGAGGGPHLQDELVLEVNRSSARASGSARLYVILDEETAVVIEGTERAWLLLDLQVGA